MTIFWGDLSDISATTATLTEDMALYSHPGYTLCTSQFLNLLRSGSRF